MSYSLFGSTFKSEFHPSYISKKIFITCLKHLVFSFTVFKIKHQVFYSHTFILSSIDSHKRYSTKEPVLTLV